MWDCGPYADLYEPLDDLEYEDVEDWLHQPMEFAQNNMRAFLYDIEMRCQAGASFKFEFGKPTSGRFKFDILIRSWRTTDSPEVQTTIWMPSARLCQIREMPATEGRRKTLLLDGEALFWEDALEIIANRVARSRTSTATN